MFDYDAERLTPVWDDYTGASTILRNRNGLPRDVHPAGIRSNSVTARQVDWCACRFISVGSSAAKLAHFGFSGARDSGGSL